MNIEAAFEEPSRDEPRWDGRAALIQHLAAEGDINLQGLGAADFETLPDEAIALYGRYFAAKRQVIASEGQEFSKELCDEIQSIVSELKTTENKLTGGGVFSNAERRVYDFLSNKIGGLSLKCQMQSRRRAA